MKNPLHEGSRVPLRKDPGIFWKFMLLIFLSAFLKIPTAFYQGNSAWGKENNQTFQDLLLGTGCELTLQET